MPNNIYIFFKIIYTKEGINAIKEYYIAKKEKQENKVPTDENGE